MRRLSTKRSFHYAWTVAAITFLTLLIGAGVRATPSVLIVPLERDFHWSRATISFAISVNLVLYGLIGPFAAEFMNRFGVRRVIAGSLLLVSSAVALTTRMSASWQLVMLWGVLVGCGTGMTALVLGATVVNRWFSAQRGVVMGVLTASTATGQLVFLPILAALIERHGWRLAALVIAGCAAAVIPFALLLIRERPADLGLAPYGEQADEGLRSAAAARPAESALAVLRSVAPSRDFWLLFASFFICGASTNGLIGTHLIPACMDHGIPEVKAAGLLAIMGVFDLIGTTSSGWLSDRFDNRYLLAWYYGLRGLSLLYLPFSFDIQFAGLSVFAVFYGLDWVATVPPTVRLTANVFGKERSATVFGWIIAGHQLGAALAAFGAGAIRTYLGNYTSAFILAGLLCATATLVVLPIGRKPAKPSRLPLAATIAPR
jgi:sugar phosphate permease